MKHLLCVFIVLAAFTLNAETIVPAGPVQGSWDQAGSPYRVTGNLSIPAGASLLVNEGVQVIIEGTYRIDVTGRMQTAGTALNPISFTAQDTLNGWSGIRFQDGSGAGLPPSGFTFTNFSYGKAIWGSGAQDPLNYGGAIWANNSGTISFDDCIFFRCVSGQDGSAIYAKNNTSIIMNSSLIKNCESGFFGGVFVKNGSAVITDCVFDSNSAVTFGAGLYFYECTLAQVISCKILNNTSGAVCGIYCYDSPLQVINSLFAGNSTTMGLGGGIGAIFGTVTVNNCSFASNSSAQGGAAIWMNSLDSPAQITNSIFWTNNPVPLTTTSTTYELHYCSLQSAEGDLTNIVGDPLFVNEPEGDFQLQAGSPCIDSGSPDVTGLLLPDNDLGGMDRVVDGNADGTPRVDIGCYEWQLPVTDGTLDGLVTNTANVPISGASVTVGAQTVQTDQNGNFSLILEAGIYALNCTATGFEPYTLQDLVIIAGQTTNVTIQMIAETGIGEEVPPLLQIMTAAPNPFKQRTELQWSLKQASRLEIFNLRGQLVRAENLGIPGSSGSWSWDGKDMQQRDLASGLYLCRVSSADGSVLIKLLKK